MSLTELKSRVVVSIGLKVRQETAWYSVVEAKMSVEEWEVMDRLSGRKGSVN